MIGIQDHIVNKKDQEVTAIQGQNMCTFFLLILRKHVHPPQWLQTRTPEGQDTPTNRNDNTNNSQITAATSRAFSLHAKNFGNTPYPANASETKVHRTKHLVQKRDKVCAPANVCEN